MSTSKPLNEKSKKLHYYTELFENSIDVIYLIEVTPDGRFVHLDINTAYAEAVALPKEAIIGRYVDELENAEFREILIRKYTSALDAGEKTDFISDYNLPIGTRTYHSTLSPIRDESGRIHRIVGIARDITEQKRQNEQIALKDREFRTLADNSPDVIVRYDAELNRVYANPAWDRISAISSVGVLGEPTIEKTTRPSHMATTYETNLKKVLENRESGDVELTLLDENDKPLFFTQRLVPEYDGEGNVIGVLTIARDITPYKKLQETLQSREREFRSLAENQPDNIARWDTQGRYLYINKVHEQTLGCSLAEVIGKRVPNEHTAVKEAIAQVAATGQKVLVHQKARLNSGEIVIHDVTIAPEFDSAGRLISILGIGRDMSEHYRQERLLRASEARFRHFFERQLVGMAITSPTHGWIQTNEKLQQMLGYSHEELTQMTWAEMTYPGDIPADIEQFERLLAGEIDDYMLEKRFIRKDGAVIYTKLAISCIRLKDQTVDYVLALIEDITDKKKGELALRESQERLQTIIENEPECIKIIDGEGKLLYMNPAGLDMIEATLEQVNGKEVLGVIVEEYRDSFVQMHRRVMAGEKVHLVFETVGLRGKHCWLETTSVPMQMDGKTVLLGVTRDITERKKAEEALAMREREFRSLAENSPNIIIRYDLECRRIYVNPAFSKHTGIPLELAINAKPDTQWDSYINMVTMTASEYQEKIQSVIRSGESANFLTELFKYVDGEYKAHDVHIVAERDTNGAIIGALVIGHDITERKRVEEALKSQSVLLQSVMESSPDVTIFALDREYNYLSFNQNHSATIKTIWGHEIALGMNMLSCITREDDKQKAKELFNRALEGECFVDDTEYGDENLSRSYWQTYYAPIHDNNGEITGLTCFTLDITEQKQLETALEAREEEYRTLTANSPDHIIRFDTQGRYLYLNPIHERTLGMSASEIIGRPKKELFSEHAAVLDAVDRIVETGEEEITVLQPVRGVNGEMETHEVKLIAEKNTEGKIVSILGIGRDITERKNMEQQLAESHNFLRQLIDAVPDPIFVKDRQHRWNLMNHAMCTLMGETSENLLGKSDYDFFSKEEADIFWAKDEEVFISKEINVNEENLTSDGNKRTLQTVKSMFVSDSGNEYLVGTIRDITERKQQEERLHKTKAKLAAIIETIPDLIWVKDAEGVYMMCNPAFEDFFGASCDEIIGKTDYDFITREQADFFRQKDAEALEAGEMRINEEEIRFAHSGQNVLLETRKVPVYNGEEFMGVLGIGRDITEKKKVEMALKESIEFSEEIINTIPDLLFELDANGTYLNIWVQDERLLTEQKAILIGNNIRDILPPDAIEVSLQTMLEVDEAGHSLGNVMYVDLAEERKYFELSASKRLSSGTYIILSRDITARKRLEQEILTNQSRLNEAQKIAKVGSWELTFPGLHLTWSDEIYRIFEIDPELYEPSYDHFLNAIHPDDREVVDKVYAESLVSKAPYEVTHRLLMNDGRIKYVHEKGETLYDAEGNPTRSIGTVQDITKQKSVEKKIEHMAHHDALTGLPNRILARERAEQIIASAKRSGTKAAFLFIDLDGFKSINDSLGHSTGDAMLKSITTRLKECVRESDTISRQGGDEFLLILSDVTEQKDIGIILDKVLKELQKPFEIATHTLSISGSIGIALYPDHAESFEALLQCADTAMYKAKDLGKNGYCFYTQQMNHNLIGQFKIQNDLKSALQNGEFVLHYQPQIDVSNHTIIGAEALIRWRHPQLGMIPPMNFIPIAESSGLIVPIGQWVIEEACEQAARWHEMGIAITVAVNISAMQFKRGNLEGVVSNALAASKIDPKYLELELTESIIMHDTENTLQCVRNLKALGVQLSIDDFGTGYSSLAYLKRFAVDKLKIDQSFVRDILSDQEDAVIVSTIVQMAKNLNLKTIAEGVETQEIVELMKSYGCDEVQGYHYAKPLEVNDFENFHASFGCETDG